MCEADLSPADQVVISKGDFACLQAINLTNSTTGDLVFMGGTKHVKNSREGRYVTRMFRGPILVDWMMGG